MGGWHWHVIGLQTILGSWKRYETVWCSHAGSGPGISKLNGKLPSSAFTSHRRMWRHPVPWISLAIAEFFWDYKERKIYLGIQMESTCGSSIERRYEKPCGITDFSQNCLLVVYLQLTWWSKYESYWRFVCISLPELFVNTGNSINPANKCLLLWGHALLH